MTVPAEPILIGGKSVYLKFYAMPRQQGDPRRIEGTMTLVGNEGVLTLDAVVGPQGTPGCVGTPRTSCPVNGSTFGPNIAATISMPCSSHRSTGEEGGA